MPLVRGLLLGKHGHAVSERLAAGKAMPGTRSHHRFVPTSNGLKIFRLSADTQSTLVTRGTSDSGLQFCDVRIGQYIAVVYDTKWYIVIIEQKCSLNEDVYVSFMTPSSKSNFFLAREERRVLGATLSCAM